MPQASSDGIPFCKRRTCSTSLLSSTSSEFAAASSSTLPKEPRHQSPAHCWRQRFLSRARRISAAQSIRQVSHHAATKPVHGVVLISGSLESVEAVEAAKSVESLESVTSLESSSRLRVLLSATSQKASRVSPSPAEPHLPGCNLSKPRKHAICRNTNASNPNSMLPLVKMISLAGF